MKNLFFSLLILMAFQLVTQAQTPRIEKNFNFDWKFSRTDNPEASQINFNDAGWTGIDVPHDWAFEEGVSRDGAQRDNGGYFGGGVGWYRKQFELSPEWLEKLVRIEFDGVYMNSEVWINGHLLGKRPYGYISFAYELSSYLKAGSNLLAVRVDNSLEPSARWYHPCGIYAPVKLVGTAPIRIARNGIKITTPEASTEKANIQIEVTLENQSKQSENLEIETILFDSKQHQLTSEKIKVGIEKVAAKSTKSSLQLKNPSLWNTETPYLYTVLTRVFEKGKLIDEVSTVTGIRSIEWKTETGFWLNGINTKLLGVCEHYEGGPVGGAWTKELLRWKLQLLKNMGCNAIRTAHNPYPPMFYDLCDEMGILVMDEAFDGWKKKAPEDYGAQAFESWWQRDLTEWMTRNRNHPSIVIYSLGNETSGPIAKDLVEWCHQLDSTRPVTSGHSGSEFMDIYGVNGGSEKTSFFTKPRPEKPFVATEAPHTWQTRGYYRTKTWFRDGYPNKGQEPFDLPDLTDKEIFHYEWASTEQWTNRKQHFNSSYDNATVRISARKNWELMRDLPWFSGHFRWTGFDYFGEAGYVHGGWPFRLFMGGALDVAGFEKDLFYFYQSQWTKAPMVHILPGWTHPTMAPGTKIPVWVYSNADEVELFLNGQSLGKDQPGTKWDEMQCEWLVPWKPGKLEAIAYRNGKEVARTTQITAGEPAKLVITKEVGEFRPSKEDVAIITTTTADKNGTIYPYGENKIYYHFDGPVRLRSLENGSPTDTTNNVGVNHRRAFMGLTRAFLQSTSETGNIGIVMGAILGERQLLNSDLVSIDVTTLDIRGKAPKSKFAIYYTTDGSEPTVKSKVYQTSFPVKSGTMVKALVLRDKLPLFTMEETFAKDAGLFWGNSGEEITMETGVGGMQAEAAKFEGAEIAKSGTDFHGNGYLDFKNREGHIKWYQENDGSEADFNLKIRFASNDLAKNRPMDLYVNGQKIATIDFPNTGSWNSNWETIEKSCKLQAGANDIELRSTGNSAPNIDELLVE